jgi:prolipoprotein diacylglyceryltransferase
MLYEALVYFTLFGITFNLVKKKIHRRYGEGFLLGIFFCVIFGARFLIEFLKEYQVPEEAALPLDLGQLLSVPFVIVGGLLILRALRAKKSRR